MSNLIPNKKVALFFYIIGFITSISICVYSFAIYQSSISKLENRPSFSVDTYGSYDTSYDIFFRFLIVAVLFLISLLLTLFSKNTFLKMLNVLLLMIIFLQGSLTLKEPLSIISYEDQTYLLSGLAILFFLGIFILFPAIILIILQIRSIIKRSTAF